MNAHATFCHGVWLPEGETHFREVLEAIAHDKRSAMYPVLAAAMLFVEKRRRCIDVGAHVGLWSRWLVDLFAKVEAFEPIEEHASLFRRNVSCDNCVLHRVALGEKPGFVGMRRFVEDTGRAHISDGNDVEMLTLDSFGFDDVDLIKIDVEGYELQVVRGATKTVLKNRPIVILEQRACEITNFGENESNQALRYLDEMGMRRIWKIEHDWVLGWP